MYAIQVLLEVEADQGLSDIPGSLLDRLTSGLVTSSRKQFIFPPFPYLYCVFLQKPTQRNR